MILLCSSHALIPLQGSVARDHLASERTFLAWMRTSLSLVSLGIAVTQLFKLPQLVEPHDEKVLEGRPGPSRWTLQSSLGGSILEQDPGALDDFTGATQLVSLHKLGKPLGALCIALGAVCLLMGAFRYYTVQFQLMRGSFKPSRIEVSLMSLFVGAFVCAAFGVIVAFRMQNA